jgi:hypothetical protein
MPLRLGQRLTMQQKLKLHSYRGSQTIDALIQVQCTQQAVRRVLLPATGADA